MGSRLFIFYSGEMIFILQFYKSSFLMQKKEPSLQKLTYIIVYFESFFS